MNERRPARSERRVPPRAPWNSHSRPWRHGRLGKQGEGVGFYFSVS